MSGVRVHVDRGRPTCPFCKDQVTSGHVWVCPGCEASHHAACHAEHGACASCALAEPRVSAATKGEAPDHDPGGLVPRRRELERLGFTIARETRDELVATHQAKTVFVRRVGHLTLARLEADLEALRADPIATTNTMLVYLADLVDRDAWRYVETGRAVGRALFGRVGLFPVVRDAATGAGTYLAFTPSSIPVGWLLLPGSRYLARRLLFPWLDPATAVEPNVVPMLFGALLLVLVAVATGVALVS